MFLQKLFLIFFAISLFVITGCDKDRKNLYLPEAKNDNFYAVIGGKNEEHHAKTDVYHGEGYTISVPADRYRYEKDYDTGNLEEKWEHIIKDDIEIKVTTYKNSDEILARGKFIKDNEDYIFEDLMGYSLCGMEPDGDTLWFHVHESGGNVYIVSWEYPRNTDNDIKTELAAIAESFAKTQTE